MRGKVRSSARNLGRNWGCSSVRFWVRFWALMAALGAPSARALVPGLAGQAGPVVEGRQAPVPPEVAAGRAALAAHRLADARNLFAGFLRAHPGNVEAELGIGDVDLEQGRFEEAEREYRGVVQAQPQLWSAHKNLVIVEAALGRWEEFDRERAVLRAARARGAVGLSARESDVIDTFSVRGERWVVREYAEPVGRGRTRYNFERFSPEGRVLGYVSLEAGDALAREFAPAAGVVIGADGAGSPGAGTAEADARPSGWALDWYNGRAHGQIAHFAEEPPYPRVRAYVLRWLRQR